MSHASCSIPRLSRSGLAAAIVLVGLIGAAPAPARDRFPMELTVADVEGQPIEGAAISIRSTTDAALLLEGMTNRKGKLKVELPDFSQVYQLQVTATGMATFTETLDMAASGLEAGATAEVKVTMREPNAQMSYNQGVTALTGGDLAKAEAMFRDAVALDATLADPYLGLAELRRRQKDLAGALAFLRQGAAAAAPNARLYNFLAFQAIELEQFDEALSASDRALALDAADPEALRSRFDALSGLGRAADADAALDQLATTVRTPDTARLLFNAGALASNAKDVVRAQQRLEQALVLDPSLHQAHSALAELRIGEQDFEAALAELDKVLALAPRNFRAFERKIEVLRALGRTADADALAEQLTALRGN